MPRTWSRSTHPEVCGACEEPIDMGQPVLRITIPTVKATLKRCHRCAGIPVPPDLPEAIEQAPRPALRAFAPIGQVALDWGKRTAAAATTPERPKAAAPAVDYKARSAGEREVGEEG